MTVVASAPGKIVLSGEYAVLSGAPAISMAIDRRAVVTARPAGDCRVRTPGFTGATRYAVVDAVSPDGRPPFDLDLDTSAFAENGDKIGFGSSAALTSALLAALRKSTDVLDFAMAAHARLQGGRGSGVDVATAVHGGLICYTAAPRSIRAVSWPAGLTMRVIWTGVPASTTDKIDALDATAARRSTTAFEAAALILAEAWGSGKTGAVLAAYGTYIARLRQFSVDHDLGIFDAGHDELTDAAMADGLIYKPAGAGGGDIGVLFGREDNALDAFVSRRSGLIHNVVSCALDPVGVRLERT